MKRLLGLSRGPRTDAKLFSGLVHATHHPDRLEALPAAHREARRLDPNAPTSAVCRLWGLGRAKGILRETSEEQPGDAGRDRWNGSACALAGLLLLAPAPQGTGVIEGRVNGLQSPRDVVVYLEDDGLAGGTPPAAEGDVVADVDQVARTFVPFVTAVPQGAVVVFHNSEDEIHNVHAKMAGKTLFNIGMPPLGRPVPRTFHEAGDVRLECDRHLTMDAWIKVLPHSYFTRPDEKGLFRLEGVPSGSRRVVAWHPYADDLARVTVVVLEEASVGVDLTLEIRD